MFLEIGIEPEDLPIELDPGRLNSGDGVIFGSGPVFHEGHGVDTLGHFIDEVGIDGLSDILPFLLLTVGVVAELLRLVEGLLIRVAKDVSGQERHLFRNIGLHLQ